MNEGIDFIINHYKNMSSGLYVCLCTRRRKSWKEHFFKTPLNREELEDFFETYTTERYDLYFCPHCFKDRYRRKEYAVPTRLLWSDLDNANPTRVNPKPNIAWETSPNRYACLWILQEERKLEETERLNKELAYANGADPSGWDITQVLRIPGTKNHKYDSNPKGKMLWDSGVRPYKNIETLKGYEETSAAILQKHNISPFFIKKLYSESKEGKRSEVLWRLENILIEKGLNREEVKILIQDSPWNKFVNRPKQLEKDIDRAFQRHPQVELEGEAPKKKTRDLFHLVPLHDVEVEKVEWLWYPYIPRGKLTIIEGDPGLGKSWLTMALACYVSQGKRLPENEAPDSHGPVIIMSAEDGLADTIKPRLMTLGSHGEDIYAIPDALTITDNSILGLKKLMLEVEPELVIIDPLVAYMGGKIDLHKANETRDVMAKLGKLAEELHTAIICVRHLSKGAKDKAIYRGLGSIDITAAARSCLAIGRNPEDPNNGRVICHIKSNLAPMGKPIAYELNPGSKNPFIFKGHISVDVNQVLNQEPTDVKGLIEEASDWLEAYLTTNGPTTSEKLHRECEAHGITWDAIKKAKKILKIDVTTKEDVITWTLMKN